MQILTESDIKEIIKLIEKPIDRTNFITIEDDIIRTLLDNYLYLTYYQDNVVEQLQIVSKEILFYSRYYWFNKFMKMYFSQYGYDSGIEQQAFEILEQIDGCADIVIDLTVIERIEKDQYVI